MSAGELGDSEPSSEVLTVDKDGPILRLTLNRPDRANALSPELVEALIAELEDPGPIRLCVLTGAGRLFCAGFDLDDFDDLSDGDLLWRFLRIEHLLQTVNYAPFPILAMAHRHAVGAGGDLLAAASHRIIAPGTRIRMPGLHFELTLGTRRLSRLVGERVARDILIDTRTVAADEALRIGMVDQIVEQEHWSEAVDTHLERVSVLPPEAVTQMLALTRVDSREADVAAVVASAGRPGLKERVGRFRAESAAARKG